jgi:hypothetical protein
MLQRLGWCLPLTSGILVFSSLAAGLLVRFVFVLLGCAWFDEGRCSAANAANTALQPFDLCS